MERNQTENLFDRFKELEKNSFNWSQSNVNERLKRLNNLKENIIDHRLEIASALYEDFKKPKEESELTEIHTTIDEINFAIKNLKKWMRPKKVKTPFVFLGARSYIYKEAKGISLIIAPWNYPFYLIMSPLVSALSAGCVTMLKPSEKAKSTSLIIEKIIRKSFAANEIDVVLGDVEVSKQIIELPFKHIFYTGSSRIGKIIMEKASRHLATVTLELGGKSPVIVDSQVDLLDAVRKISWGKFVNAGQTCVAPDYCLIHESLKEEFLKLMKEQIEFCFGNSVADRMNSTNFARIIDSMGFARLNFAIEKEEKILPDISNCDNGFYIPPTILANVKMDSLIMSEEIFGPILPVISYETLDEAISFIQSKDKPLAFYIFSNNKENQNRLLNEISSGGAIVNHVLIHLGNPNLPFGGVGPAGMGASHGEYGFLEFTHQKSVLIQGKFSLSTFYFPPYQSFISKLAYRLLKYLE